MCVSVLVYRTDTTDVPTLHRSGSNPPALDTLPSSDRAGHGRRPAVSQPFGREGNSGPFQEERQSAQGHQRRDTRGGGALATRANVRRRVTPGHPCAGAQASASRWGNPRMRGLSSSSAMQGEGANPQGSGRTSRLTCPAPPLNPHAQRWRLAQPAQTLAPESNQVRFRSSTNLAFNYCQGPRMTVPSSSKQPRAASVAVATQRRPCHR